MPIEKPNQGHGYKPRTLQDVFRNMPQMDIPKEIIEIRKEKLQNPVQTPSRSVRILDQEADHLDSMRILEENNLRPLTYQELLTTLPQTPDLKERLKGRGFWIAGKGEEINGFIDSNNNWELFTFDNQGNLTKVAGASVEETVRVWKGNDDNPLWFLVRTDYYARDNGGRFGLGAGNGPDLFASMVVGVPK